MAVIGYLTPASLSRQVKRFFRLNATFA